MAGSVPVPLPGIRIGGPQRLDQSGGGLLSRRLPQFPGAPGGLLAQRPGQFTPMRGQPVQPVDIPGSGSGGRRVGDLLIPSLTGPVAPAFRVADPGKRLCPGARRFRRGRVS
ncbi:hypothetical protein GCM10027160_54620 [Streptomyces calidiresistens]